MEGDIEENKTSVSVAEETNSKDNHKDTNEESVSASAADNNDETGSSIVEDSNNNGNSQTNNSYGLVPVVAASPPPPQWAQMPYAGPVVPMLQQYAPPQYFPYSPQHPYGYFYDPIPHHHEPSPSQPMGNGGAGWSSSYGGNRSIWVGDLEEWMDENYLLDCFASTGEVSSVKVIRNRLTGRHLGYGFVEFVSHGAAERALWSYPWMRMPSTNQPFRLNWAKFSAANNKLSNNSNINNGDGDGDGSDHSIFVGDLASDVNDSLLHATFSAKYPSAKAAKVVIDPNTGRSKGYGFVRFGDETEMSKAMSEMEGIYCSTRPMRIGIATRRKKSSSHYHSSSQTKLESSSGGATYSHSDGDSANTTIFVGGLDPEVSGEELKQPFAQYGEIVSVKIPKGKGCGFVQFVNRNDAEKALQELNSTMIGKRTVRLAWGHSLSNKQSNENGFGHGWTTGAYYYYGGPYYDGYGYPMHYLM